MMCRPRARRIVRPTSNLRAVGTINLLDHESTRDSDTTMNTEIEVCERVSDWWLDAAGNRQPKYHAQLKGKPEIWACGRSTAEAIGGLIMTWPKKVGGFKVEHLGKLPR